MIDTSTGARAKRFSIRTAVRYKPADDAKWHTGRTENLSCSGALVTGRLCMHTSVPVEMILPIPPQLSGKAEVEFLCRGHVVRVARPAFALLRPKFAVRWKDISILNAEAQPVRKDVSREDWRTMIHELYSEIAIIVGSSDLLVHAPDEMASKRVTAIKQASERAVILVNGLATVLKNRNC